MPEGYEQNPLPQIQGRQYGSKRRGKLSQKTALKRYQHDVEVAQKSVKSMHKDWERYIKLYEGHQWLSSQGVDIEPRDAVVINHIASIVNTILPAVTTQPPKLRAIPLRPDGEDSAPFVEAVLNYEWMRLSINDELKLATYDMLITGNGVIKVGYEFSTEEVDRDPDEVELEIQQLLARQQAQLAGDDISGVLPSTPEEDPSLGTGDPELAMQTQEQLMSEMDMEMQGGQQDPNAPVGSEQELGGLTPEGAGAMPPQSQTGMEEGLAGGFGEQEQLAMLLESQVQGGGGGKLLDEGLPEPSPMEADQIPPLATEDEIRAAVPTTEEKILVDDVFVERVSPFEVFVDPEARSLREARWVAQRIVKSLEDVKANKQYKNTGKLKPTEESKVARMHGAKPVEEGLGDYTQRVVIWEYYNLKDRRLCIFAEGHDRFLFEGDYTYPFEGSPFVILRDYLVPDKLWGFGEVQMIEGAQVELNKTRTMQLVHRKRANRKILYRREGFDPDGVDALKSDQDMVLVPVAHGQNLAEVVQPVPDMNMPPDLYQMSNVIEADLNLLSGVSDYQRGEFLPRHVTASEANLMQNAQDLRARDKLDRVEKASTEIGRMIKALAQTFYDQTRWVLIMGNGVSVPMEFTKEDIKGEYDVRVDASSTQPTNEVFAQQTAERLYQLMRQDPLIKGEELIKHVLKSYGMTAPERFILSPEEQMMQQMQVMGLDPSATGMQPGQAEGNVNPPAELAAAIAGGQEAVMG